MRTIADRTPRGGIPVLWEESASPGPPGPRLVPQVRGVASSLWLMAVHLYVQPGDLESFAGVVGAAGAGAVAQGVAFVVPTASASDLVDAGEAVARAGLGGCSMMPLVYIEAHELPLAFVETG